MVLNGLLEKGCKLGWVRKRGWIWEELWKVNMFKIYCVKLENFKELIKLKKIVRNITLKLESSF